MPSKNIKKLDKIVISLLKVINIIINVFIFKAKLYPRLIMTFDEKCKNTEMRTRKLKKICRKEGIEDS